MMALVTMALVMMVSVVIAFGGDGFGGDGFGDDVCGGESFVCQPGRLPACGLRWPETQSCNFEH